MNSFQKAMIHIIEAEGSQYTNRPSDRGGPTRYGITLKTLSKYRGYIVTAQDVQHLTENEARNIYREFYWDKLRLSEMPERLALVLFDQAVNRGPETATQLLQKTLGTDMDGVLGPITRSLALSQDETSLIWDFLKECAHSYVRICLGDASQMANLSGWLNRLYRLAERFVLDGRVLLY